MDISNCQPLQTVFKRLGLQGSDFSNPIVEGTLSDFVDFSINANLNFDRAEATQRILQFYATILV